MDIFSRLSNKNAEAERTKPMKTLTITENNRWYVIGSDTQKIPWEQIPHELYGALCKLHDYEKSGLTPDEVNRLVANFKNSG